MICDICQKKIDYDDIHQIEIRESLGGSDWSSLNMVETFKVCGGCRKDVLEYIESKKTKTQICRDIDKVIDSIDDFLTNEDYMR